MERTWKGVKMFTGESQGAFDFQTENAVYQEKHSSLFNIHQPPIRYYFLRDHQTHVGYYGPSLQHINRWGTNHTQPWAVHECSIPSYDILRMWWPQNNTIQVMSPRPPQLPLLFYISLSSWNHLAPGRKVNMKRETDRSFYLDTQPGRCLSHIPNLAHPKL